LPRPVTVPAIAIEDGAEGRPESGAQCDTESDARAARDEQPDNQPEGGAHRDTEGGPKIPPVRTVRTTSSHHRQCLRRWFAPVVAIIPDVGGTTESQT
jgi:hypothetical protein